MLYVVAPDGVMVKAAPEQIVPLLTDITGKEFIDTVAIAVLVAGHPAELLPVIE